MKEFVIRTVFCIEINYRRNDWKHFSCVIKETVFYIRIDYRFSDFKQIVLFLEIHSPLMYIVHFSKDYTKTPFQLRRQGAKNVYFREVTIKDISSSFIVC